MVIDYGWFAERYHWTPEQVERLPQWYARRLPPYATMLDELDAERRRKSEGQR